MIQSAIYLCQLSANSQKLSDDNYIEHISNVEHIAGNWCVYKNLSNLLACL